MVLEQRYLGPCYTTDFPLTEMLGSQKYFCAWMGSVSVSSPASSSEQDQLQKQMRFHGWQKRLAPTTEEDTRLPKTALSHI